MFGTKYLSENRQFRLYITITCSGTKKIRVWAEESGNPNSKYADREINVNGTRTIFFSFPVSPKELFIGVANSKVLDDKDLNVTLEEQPLVTYNVWLREEARSFVKFAIPFCQMCGFENANASGRTFSSPDKEFTIKFYDQIRDKSTQKMLNTPARIGHKTGIIEVAKDKFEKYTIPMRLVILLHEFSHKYNNPKIGLEISNEFGADINALYIYLGLGFSPIDAICVFAKVFLKAQTQSNMERMRKIMNYIQRFENQEFASKN